VDSRRNTIKELGRSWLTNEDYSISGKQTRGATGITQFDWYSLRITETRY